MPMVNCGFCGKLHFKSDIMLESKRRRGHNNYCDTECFKDSQRKRKKPLIPVPCEQCGKIHFRTNAAYNQNIRKGYKFYCSKACFHKSCKTRKRPRKKVKMQRVFCAGCGIEFLKDTWLIKYNIKRGFKNYCTRNCFLKNKHRMPLIPVTCEYCDITFFKINALYQQNIRNGHKFYCSTECHHKGMKGRKITEEHRQNIIKGKKKDEPSR